MLLSDMADGRSPLFLRIAIDPHFGEVHRWTVTSVSLWQHGQVIGTSWAMSMSSFAEFFASRRMAMIRRAMAINTRRNITMWYCGKYHSHPSGFRFTDFERRCKKYTEPPLDTARSLNLRLILST
jgi:hypothetical protein